MLRPRLEEDALHEVTLGNGAFASYTYLELFLLYIA